jgi:site-specific recombinase XerD
MPYDAQVDLLQIRNLMGHSTVEMTARYIGVRTEQLTTTIGKLPALVPA